MWIMRSYSHRAGNADTLFSDFVSGKYGSGTSGETDSIKAVMEKKTEKRSKTEIILITVGVLFLFVC